MKKLKIALVGANGRMGLEITRLIQANQRLEAAVAVSRQGKSAGFKKSVKGFADVDAKEIGVVIDFSAPEMLKKTLQFCVKNEVPLVVGVTGISAVELKALQLAANKTAILYAPNMSLGIAVLKSSLSLLAELKNFDFQIVEAHHRFKKDKPSGTALLLQSELEKVTRKNWPAPISIRAGGIVGEHEIVGASEGEVIKISHQALNRSVFAEGALRAAEWLSKNKNGFFQMEDVLRG